MAHLSSTRVAEFTETEVVAALCKAYDMPLSLDCDPFTLRIKEDFVDGVHVFVDWSDGRDL